MMLLLFLALRKYLLSEDRPTKVKQQAAVIIKAFNYWREGRELQVIRWRSGGRSPEAFPKINPAVDGEGASPVEPVDPSALNGGDPQAQEGDEKEAA